MAGVVSWGVGCGVRYQPGVMVRVAEMRVKLVVLDQEISCSNKDELSLLSENYFITLSSARKAGDLGSIPSRATFEMTQSCTNQC